MVEIIGLILRLVTFGAVWYWLTTRKQQKSKQAALKEQTFADRPMSLSAIVHTPLVTTTDATPRHLLRVIQL